MENTDSKYPVIFLMGATATGKTGLAVELHDRLPVEIISVDSAMIYRGMDIGTAKPSPQILAKAPHRLIDICDPEESYSAARFCEDAMSEIKKIHELNRIPLLVGGTGLYFRSLENGLSELPSADQTIRKRIEAEAEEYGWEQVHTRLAKIDPVAAKRIHPNDPQRIQRALEVFEITGKPISAHFDTQQPVSLESGIIKIIINPAERKVLHKRIAERFNEMLSNGLVDEVKKLREGRKLHPGLPSMRLVGYRQVWQYLDGKLDYQQMIERAIVATRQLAKRQVTWFRKEQNCGWFDSLENDLISNLLIYINNYAQKNH